MVQMKKIEKYLNFKTAMLQHMVFAVENDSLQDSLYHLIFYHWYKDKMQQQYFAMSHEEHKTLHGLLIL
jgi:hypothetical protein